MSRHRRGYTGERFTELLGVKLTPSQRAELVARAEAAGLPVSDFARRLITGTPDRRPATGLDPTTARQFTAQLAHLGNNLNQIAKVANQTGRIRSEESLERVTAEIIATMRKVVGA
jgi:hypothetical protein